MTFHRPGREQSGQLMWQAAEWTGQPEEADAPADTPWTMGRLKDAARIARSRVIGRSIRPSEAIDLALSEIGLAVAENPHLSFNEAVSIGQYAITNTARVSNAQSGRSDRGDMPRFAAFWYDRSHSSGYGKPWAVIDSMSINQVFDALPDRHRKVLLLVMYAETVNEAAATTGLSQVTFRRHFAAARSAALALLYDHEQPPPLNRLPIHRKGRDRICRQGHLIAGDNVRKFRKGTRQYETCRTCAADAMGRWKAKQ